MSENAVTFNGRTFELHEPSISTVLSILNVIGKVGTRAEKEAMQVASNPTSRAVLFGLLATMKEDDLVHLGIAVLQIGDDKDAQKWLYGNLKVSPLLDAFFINLSLSSDLMDALKSFFKGADLLAGTINAFAARIKPKPAEGDGVSSASPEVSANS